MGNKQSIKNEERSSSDDDNGLSYYQIQALQRAWKHMSKAGQTSCGRQIITKIYQKNSELRVIFQRYASINNLSNYQKKPFEWGILKHELIEEKCQELGRDHRTMKQYGMKEEHWDILGEAISETICESYAWKKNRQLIKASNILTSFIIDRIRSGFIEKEGKVTKLPMKCLTPENKLKSLYIKRCNTIGNGDLHIKKIHSPIHTKYYVNHNMTRAKSFDSKENPKRRILPIIPHLDIGKIEQEDYIHNFQRRISSKIIQNNKSNIFNKSRPCICNFTNIDYDMEGNIVICKEKF
uniref:MADF domain-containing protein n=1 Tax=Strongyloides stercoralis TaxID=6248 RepID=A0A0K0EPM0_STRER